MCTGLEIAAVVGAAASAVGAASSIQQGQTQQKIGEYNAQIAQNNAIAAQQKAAYDEQRQREVAVRLKGTQRASAAAAGGELLDMSDVLDESAKQAELDALAIRYGGSVQSNAAKQTGILSRAQGSVAAGASYGQAGSSLLTGASGLFKTFGK